MFDLTKLKRKSPNMEIDLANIPKEIPEISRIIELVLEDLQRSNPNISREDIDLSGMQDKYWETYSFEKKREIIWNCSVYKIMRKNRESYVF
jgi:hypothetical protein